MCSTRYNLRLDTQRKNVWICQNLLIRHVSCRSLRNSGGAVYTDKQQVVEFDIKPRLNALQEVLDETTNKVVVFVPYLHTIDVLTKFLDKEGVTNAVIQGSVGAKERSTIIDQFQKLPDPRVLVIQPQSAAHGITLTAADTIVFWSPVMSVETYLQCIGRIERVGQKNAMTVVHLQGSEVEKKMYTMLQGKVDSHQRIVDLYKQELDEVEVADGALKEDLQKLEAALLDICNSVNADSIKTTHGTVMRKLNERFFCQDWDNFYKYVLDNEAVQLLERRIHQSNFREHLKEIEGDGLPPGVNVMREYGVSVRKATSRE